MVRLHTINMSLHLMLDTRASTHRKQAQKQIVSTLGLPRHVALSAKCRTICGSATGWGSKHLVHRHCRSLAASTWHSLCTVNSHGGCCKLSRAP